MSRMHQRNMHTGFLVYWIVALLVMYASVSASAQHYEIRLVEQGEQATIQMRCLDQQAPGPADWITDLVFGVRWKSPDITGLEVVAGTYKIRTSGTPLTHKGYQLQPFGAFETPFVVPATWKIDAWMDLVALRINGKAVREHPDDMLLQLAPSGFHIQTDPNFGISLEDFTPKVVD